MSCPCCDARLWRRRMPYEVWFGKCSWDVLEGLSQQQLKIKRKATVHCAGLAWKKAEEGRTLDAVPLLRCEALKTARALWGLVWRVIERCARGVVPTAIENQEKACSVCIYNHILLTTDIHFYCKWFELRQRNSQSTANYGHTYMNILPHIHQHTIILKKRRYIYI